MSEPGSFAGFWPYYVSQHRDPVNRALHFTGTTLALAALAIGAARLSAAWLPLALLAGYGPAWAGHFFFEKNRPATFRHPLWSLVGDFRMYGLMWLGRMSAEVERTRALA